MRNSAAIDGTLPFGMTTRKAAFALLLLTLAIYVNSLGGGFIWDDEFIFLDNPYILSQTVRSAFTHEASYFFPHTAGQQYYRPLHLLAFSWLARVTRMQPFGMHLIVVLTHAAAAILAFLLLAEFVEPVVAWFAAALFVVHPLHVEAVAWLAAYSEVLAAALMLLSLYALVRSRRGPPWLLWASYAAGMAAFLTKETTMTLPFLAAALLVFGEPRDASQDDGRQKPLTPDGRRAGSVSGGAVRAVPAVQPGIRYARAAKLAAPFVALAGAVVALRIAVIGFASVPVPHRPFHRHALMILRAAVQYAGKLVWPWPLAPEYDLEHSIAAYAAFALACAAGAWIAWRSVRARLALTLLVVPLLPALAGAIGLPTHRLAQDRYTYLAILGLTLAVSSLCSLRRRIGITVGLALLLLWGGLSEGAILHWRDTGTLWTHTLTVTPDSKTAVLGLGEWYMLLQQRADAERVYRHGLRYYPNDPDLRKMLQTAQARPRR